MMKTLAPSNAVLEDLQWLQRLAGLMARDTDEADDLVQDTLVQVWRDPPDESKPLRPWLGTVLRNRLRMRKRGEIRREAREQHAPAMGTEPRAPDREHERLEVLRVLLAELQALPAEDQKIIVRRFFEGESAADIGRALDIPSATIRSRIHRSLGRLRESLDHRFGSRQTWCAAVVALPPSGGVVPVATNAGSSSTMSFSMKALLLAALGGTTGVAGWLALTPEPAAAVIPMAAVETPTAPPLAIDPEGVELQPNDDLHARWQRRRESIRSSLPAAVDDAPPPELGTEDLRGREQDRPDIQAFRELVDACMEDLGARSVGSVTLSIREIGAPDVGTIYESVEVVDQSFDEPEVIECLTQSMYAFVGEAPAGEYERVFGITAPLGKPETPDDKDAQVFGAIVGAHMGEVRFCESKAEGAVAGEVTVAITIGASGLPESVEAEPSALPAAVVECIVGATKRWQLPTRMTGKRFERAFALPVPGGPPGPVGDG
jgi:RNA polymerase sigma factor (sigma-70 family)